MNYQVSDTIAAIATPPGEGGIAIIRISGKEALQVAQKVFSGHVFSYKSHTAHLGIIYNELKERLDEGLLLLMLGPKSYTGEDTVELHCHGGMLASKKVLEAVLKAGARPAQPGEFTFKAFMNGKIDLAQAEAVQKIISAKNEYAYSAANNHLAGSLSEKIKNFQKKLFSIAAIFEAWVDFPEEGIEFASQEELFIQLDDVLENIEKLLFTFEEGKKIEQGISLCIVGPPNAGKSSLMNALLDTNRAIVTPIPGTTRDLISEDFQLGGLHFKLIDTAGIRETEDLIEKEGIKRSEQALKEADLTLLVLDGTQKENRQLISLCEPNKTIIVWNKNDLSGFQMVQTPFPYQVALSAKERRGLEELKEALHQCIWQKGLPSKDEIIITTVRHYYALNEAREALIETLKGLKEGISPEFLVLEIRKCLFSLGKLIGIDITEEILTSIFSQFCIGK